MTRSGARRWSERAPWWAACALASCAHAQSGTGHAARVVPESRPVIEAGLVDGPAREDAATTDGDPAGAVVAIVSSGRPVCTATLVAWGDEVGLITAAHCFALDADGQLTGRAPSVAALGSWTTPIRRVLVHEAFDVCRDEGVPYQECVESRAADLAFVPLAIRPAGVAPWRIARDAPPARASLATLGFGAARDGDDEPELTRLDISDRPQRGYWVARGVEHSAPIPGDSGGPVFGASGSGPPLVYFVAVARGFDGDGAYLLQPVWDLSLNAPEADP